VALPQKATRREGFATNREGGYTRTRDFDADIREQIFARLPRAPEVDAELSAMATRDLLTIYGYWLSRLISPQPRQVVSASAKIPIVPVEKLPTRDRV
jgi:hypothetical protein